MWVILTLTIPFNYYEFLFVYHFLILLLLHFQHFRGAVVRLKEITFISLGRVFEASPYPVSSVNPKPAICYESPYNKTH